MLALELTDVKDFMNKFLRTEIFDHFLLQEGAVTTAVSYTIDGQLTREFYDSGEMEELGLDGLKFIPYGMLRNNCFDLIKGKKTPVSFRFVLLLSPENLSRTLAGCSSPFTENDISGVFVNIRYKGQKLTLTTGISYRIFSTDRTLEHEWDRLVEKFLKKHEISFAEL